MKDNSFARFFNPSKSKKRHESMPEGKLLWDSRKKGTKFKSYSHITRKMCDNCGKVYKVYHNLYGTKSGVGTCDCGEKTLIN